MTDALLMLFHPWPMLLILMGVSVGIFAGAVPGLTGGMVLALALPLTFYMAGQDAVVLLVSIYVGVVTGGMITAIVLNIPGTPANLVTAWDGHPMAKRGEAAQALGLGIAASFVGCVVSWLFLISLAPLLARIALTFNQFDFFAMVVMALMMISSLSEGSMVRAVISGLLGVLVALPGLDPVSAQLRLTFGHQEMAAGFQLLPVLIGLFGVSQILSDSLQMDEKTERAEFHGSIFPRLATWRRQAVNGIRSSVIGTWIGILPGLGTTIGSLVAYAITKNSSSYPEKFGTGIEDGVVASEAANNATVGGGLIPVITLGIPGSVGDVILLAALILHGVTPGPLLFANNPEIAWGIIWTMLIASVVMVVVMGLSARWIARVVDIPKVYVIPAVMVLCIVGAFAINNRMFDVWVMLGSGILGYVLIQLRVPLGPFSIGFILAPIAELSLRSALMSSGGSFAPLVTQPTSALFLALAVITCLWPLWRSYTRTIRARRESRAR